MPQVAMEVIGKLIQLGFSMAMFDWVKISYLGEKEKQEEEEDQLRGVLYLHGQVYLKIDDDMVYLADEASAFLGDTSTEGRIGPNS